MKKILFSTIIMAMTMANTAMALPILPPLFSDNMVFQQQTNAPIWGSAKANKKVIITASWNQEKIIVRADNKGEWRASLQTPEAGGPYTISISDGQTITLRNVLVGEVWLCSGQSNMEFPVKGWAQVINADKEVAEANHQGIRLLQIHRWQPSNRLAKLLLIHQHGRHAHRSPCQNSLLWPIFLHVKSTKRQVFLLVS